jgi:Flp pilus assembly pilin Flp
MKALLTQKHSGAVSFEYIIILVIMAVAIFIAWGVLSGAVENKANDISEFIASNGQTSLGT